MQLAEDFILTIMYGGKTGDTLNSHRVKQYQRAVARTDPGGREFDLASICTTRGAARQHGLRVYITIQGWVGNELNPEEWGWYKRPADGVLRPVPTLQPPAPEYLLKMIFCSCKTCGSRCPCGERRCTAMCTNCAGHACGNAPDNSEALLQPEDSSWTQMTSRSTSSLCNNN